MPIDETRVRQAEAKCGCISPLSQSRRSDVAGDIFCIHKHAQRTRVADSEAAARENKIHRILAAYLNHLVETRRVTDLEVLDSLVKRASAEVWEGLQKFRDNHAFDPGKIVATELHIALDESFRLIDHSEDDPLLAAFEGTLNPVMLHSLAEPEIDDWKTYYQIIDTDALQSKLYPLLLMCLNPSLEKVRFALEFVRYGVSRCVDYTRNELPWL